MAVLHTERAVAGLGGWERAHTWLAAAADGDISAGPNSTLFFGAPALAFALHAAADRPGRYARALELLDNDTGPWWPETITSKKPGSGDSRRRRAARLLLGYLPPAQLTGPPTD